MDDTPRTPLTATPRVLEQMSEAEIEEIMAQRRKPIRREWGRDVNGELRPLSAWDRLYE